MKKLVILAICLFCSGCTARTTTVRYAVKNNLETIPPAVQKAADYAVFVYARDGVGKFTYSASGFVFDKNGVIGTARHNLPNNRSHRLYVLIKEGKKITIRRVLMWLKLTDTDVAILIIRHKFSGAMPLRFTPPRPNEKFYCASYPYVHWYEVPYRVQRVISHGYFFKFEMYNEKWFRDIAALANIPIMTGASGSAVLDADGRAIGIVSFSVTRTFIFTGFLSVRHAQMLLDHYKKLLLLKKLPPL